MTGAQAPGGALYGLAVGDALGMPTESLPRSQVIARYGPLLDWFRPGAADQPLAPGLPAGNANRIVEGDLFLVRDPLQVLTAHESGIENVVAFLTENVTALQLEQLAALMDERKCEHMEIF